MPPDETFPQVAIVSAVGRAGDRPAHGWRAIPLWGEGDAVVLAGLEQPPGGETARRLRGDLVPAAQAPGSLALRLSTSVMLGYQLELL